MPKPRTGWSDDEPPLRAVPCAACEDREPQQRMAHHLRIAKDEGLDALKAHLMDVYVYKRETHRQRPDSVDDICRWTAQLMEQYSGLVDPQTGADLPWWEARRQMQQAQPQMDRQMYERAPEKYRRQTEGQGRSVSGFYQVPPSAQGKFSAAPKLDTSPRILESCEREPGEDPIDEEDYL